MAVAAARGGEDQAKLVAVTQEAQPLAARPEHPLRQQGGAEAVGAAPEVRGVQIGARRPGPDPENRLGAGAPQDPAAVLRAFAGDHLALPLHGGVAQALDEGLEDVGGHPRFLALVAQLAKLAAVGLPAVGDVAAPAVQQELLLPELSLQFEGHEGLRKGGADETAVLEVQRHGAEP